MDQEATSDAQPQARLASVEEAQALLQLMGGGVTLAALSGITPRRLEAYYALGYTCYRSGRYQDAERIFSFVLLQNHLDARTHKALGMTLQMQRKHEQALKPYGAASLMDLTDPEPVVRMAECLLALARLDEALGALDFAQGMFRRRPDARLSQRVEAIRELITKPHTPAVAAA